MLQTILETGGVPRIISKDIAAQVLREYRADVRQFFMERRGEVNFDLRDVLTYVGVL